MQSDDLGLVATLRGLCIDWTGEPIVDGSMPRIEPDCATLREAAAAIERLVAERDVAREAWQQAFDLGVHHQSRAEAAEALLDFATFSPWLRDWCRRRFGKWITHNTAKGALNDLRARQALKATP